MKSVMIESSDASSAAMRLRLEGVCKRYGPLPVLTDVTFHIRPGEAVGVVGPNGAGKSTLLRILAGLIRPTAGRIAVDGCDQRRNPHFRRRLGYLSHDSMLYDPLSARENLRFTAELYDLPDAGARIDRLLREIGLEWAGELPVRTYSRGMVQRLSLARALLHEPDLLLLDEPHTGLDPEAAEGLGRLLKRFQEGGGTLLLATHEWHRIPDLVDRVILLHRGRVRAERAIEPGGKLEDLIAFYRLAVSDGPL
ncbi:MAG: heme ABC exporter ATP-binding protein CcmA [Candidatus Eisenbacteria bacterium]|uniref:Heme ABC exporter ATP-binding protein CcmA n=1 Tax=Eiseniibacteriota bacterium TaxID=2212470 RepID=A0A948RS51_UNCEI|nr:heme ABC exporter ATP-binding protein CcmA [Candidatus Eisenbacteria bacterium]MBU1950149.1 heme ABC exporter ATP-binding protein CcmA [Candidatus Eisenbacteria bacterium]MBU2689601.1 heme ABC exporter ATP-binding protein CcmA [Candidatus Eisenbacteria bacterium]